MQICEKIQRSLIDPRLQAKHLSKNYRTLTSQTSEKRGKNSHLYLFRHKVNALYLASQCKVRLLFQNFGFRTT